MIPAEAVEAAVPYEAIVEASRSIDDDAYALLGWEGITRVLEAAAPYMLAAAWDQGWDAFASFDSRPGGPYPTSPYMPNTEGEK